jgi:hypothetical protein
VSQNILLGYDFRHGIRVGGRPSSLMAYHREALLGLAPRDRVGRTIRIYALKDLPFRLAPLPRHGRPPSPPD